MGKRIVNSILRAMAGVGGRVGALVGETCGVGAGVPPAMGCSVVGGAVGKYDVARRATREAELVGERVPVVEPRLDGAHLQVHVGVRRAHARRSDGRVAVVRERTGVALAPPSTVSISVTLGLVKVVPLGSQNTVYDLFCAQTLPAGVVTVSGPMASTWIDILSAFQDPYRGHSLGCSGRGQRQSSSRRLSTSWLLVSVVPAMTLLLGGNQRSVVVVGRVAAEPRLRDADGVESAPGPWTGRSAPTRR